MTGTASDAKTDTTTNTEADARSWRQRSPLALIIWFLAVAIFAGIGGVVFDRVVLGASDVAAPTDTSGQPIEAPVSSFKPALSGIEAHLFRLRLPLISRTTTHSSDAGRDITSSGWGMDDGNVVTVADNTVDTIADPGVDALNWCGMPTGTGLRLEDLLKLGSEALTKAHAAWPHYAKSDNGFSSQGVVIVASGTKVTCYHKVATSN